MAYRDPEIGRQRGRERFRRRVAERRARNLCPRCGKIPPTPGLGVCEPCGQKRRAAGRARDARLRAAGKKRRNPERARQYRREHRRRLTEERLAQGLCPRCGKQRLPPERSLCASCGEKRREADRARYARAKARGALYGGRGVESKRRSARARSRRLRLQRLAEGRCTRCGANSPIEGRTVCETCIDTRRMREREQYAARRSAGRCGKCGVATFEGASRCAPCAVLDAKRQDRKNAASRTRYTRRRMRGLCTDCSAPSGGAARRRAAMILTRIKAGGEPVPKPLSRAGDGPTVAEVAERYFREHLEVRCKPGTARIRRYVIGKHILPRFGNLPVSAIRREDVATLHYELRKAPTVANDAVSALSHMLNRAEAWGLAPAGGNPCRFVAKYKSRKRERFLTHEEFRRLGRVLSTMETQGRIPAPAAAALRLLMLTGCRVNEILTLRWEDVPSGGERDPASRQQDWSSGGPLVSSGGEGSRGPSPRGGQSLGHRRTQGRLAPEPSLPPMVSGAGESGP